MSKQSDLELLKEEILVNERLLRLQEGLPHLHGYKKYPWAREYYESTNKHNFLVAANQIGKSHENTIKCIDWATNVNKWPMLWRNKPNQFWYMYPNAKTATIEFETKWLPLLPKNEFKTHPIYGWKEEWESRQINAVKFNSGVNIYFKTYTMDVQNLQAASVYALWLDEELPEPLLQELQARLLATQGYLHMVFTATLGQELWRKTMEPYNSDEELFKGAFKKCVSMYDCQKFEDGTPSHWTDGAITQVIAGCQTQNEVMRRVYGKFVLDSGRKYESFDIKRHMIEAFPIPQDWHIYAGIDVGSGGEKGHPSAIAFIAVKPDFQEAVVFDGWRGDGISTTAGDVLEKFLQMKADNRIKKMDGQYYDWACVDLMNIATRSGVPLIPADKNHARGEQILGVLFKNDMLKIFNTPELVKFGQEFASLKENTPKNKAKDDGVDSCRYGVSRIPWDWSAVKGVQADSNLDVSKPKPLDERSQQIEDRRHGIYREERNEEDAIDAELREWNQAYE